MRTTSALTVQAPEWLAMALLLSTLLLEVWDAWRSWSTPEPTISAAECERVCEGAIRVWSTTSCECCVACEEEP